MFNVLEGMNYKMTVLWVEGRVEVAARQGRRRKQLLYDLKAKRGYWKLRQEAQYRTL
jgi:hypothetical protein